jgi:hypothetical protein
MELAGLARAHKGGRLLVAPFFLRSFRIECGLPNLKGLTA